MRSFLEKLIKFTSKLVIIEGFNKVFQNRKVEKKSKNMISEAIPAPAPIKNHPWRLCPVGSHWVRPHNKHLKTGTITDHRGTCRENPQRKTDYYKADEIEIIATTYFDSLVSDKEVMPAPDQLGFTNGNQFDLLIAGWTKYWNEVLEPEVPLSPDLVKALIATESPFEIPQDQLSSAGAARGPIQVTEQTRKILQDLNGELNDHHIELTVDESRVPVTNIAAGIRWLHYKKSFLERRKQRKATWEEAVAEYKGLQSSWERA